MHVWEFSHYLWNLLGYNYVYVFSFSILFHFGCLGIFTLVLIQLTVFSITRNSTVCSCRYAMPIFVRGGVSWKSCMFQRIVRIKHLYFRSFYAYAVWQRSYSTRFVWAIQCDIWWKFFFRFLFPDALVKECCFSGGEKQYAILHGKSMKWCL